MPHVRDDVHSTRSSAPFQYPCLLCCDWQTPTRAVVGCQEGDAVSGEYIRTGACAGRTGASGPRWTHRRIVG
ncbi:hypothetical protein CLOM_g10246 [Closterium sp. NIES-68]|nr:hypothetical protein CLOM_g10246 [Closterium sp. NIES-68]GJP59510.1 hypothetical protein CLOP_g12415 [Closterium sp. NIES-67]